MFNFLMGGMNYQLESLSPKLDHAFMELYESFAGPKHYDLSLFEEAVLDFLDSHLMNWAAHDHYFVNFTILWKQFRKSGRFDEAEAVWDLAVKPVLLWEILHPNSFVHKGTPFYFWGMTAILRGDIDKGYSLMHRALEEDKRTDPLNYTQKPGFFFATLNYTRADQAFRNWLLTQANLLKNHLQVYAVSYQRSFELEDFQKRFLSAPPSIEAVSLLGYVVARLMRLELIPGFARESNFAGQIEGNLLFDLVSVIDAAIGFKNQKTWKFGEHAEYLSVKRGGQLKRAQMEEINQKFIGDFDATMGMLLENRLQLKDRSTLDAMDSTIAIAYGIRNRWAHGVPSANVIWRRFDEIKQRALDTLFATVDFLY